VATSPPSPKPFIVRVTLRFIYINVFISILVAFTVGRLARVLLIDRPSPQWQEDQLNEESASLPTPLLLDGKEVPITEYTAKHFDTSKSAHTVSKYLQNGVEHTELDMSEAEPVCSNSDTETKCSRGLSPTPSVTSSTDSIEDEEEEHLPAGQHLLIDIRNVSSQFLNSELRLAQAMIDVVNLSKLTLLSYHCHSLIPMGVSCVGVLLESHVSFHTWPKEGVITLDLFTCGSGELVPVLPIIERLFAVPMSPEELIGNEKDSLPYLVWSHKLRGFRNRESENYLSTELGRDMLGDLTYTVKEKLASTQTKYQHIDIYNRMHPTESDYSLYLRSLSNDGSYYSKNPALYGLDRTVYLDGVSQSTLHGLEAYHEALVHPAMFAHYEPKRVAIIGGGECATLREVLKHNTITNVKMIEIDEEMVEVSRKALPEWSDCSDIVGSAAWCGDDERADIYYEDAMAWFNNRFSEESKIDSEEYREDPFDILIMDALDPQDNVPFADVLYNNENFLRTLYNALSKDGIIVLQLGRAPTAKSPAEDFSRDSRRDMLTKSLGKIGFKSIHTYEEAHCGFEEPWTYLIAMKDKENRALWYRTIAEKSYDIYERILKTESGEPALKFVDSITMNSYLLPTKGHETVYCRKDPMPDSCAISLKQKNVVDVPISNFEVKNSTIGEYGGRGVFTKIDIKKGTSLARDEQSVVVEILPYTLSVMEYLKEAVDSDDDEIFNIDDVLNYVYGYGWSTAKFGLRGYNVDSGYLTFCNHGCQGSYNVETSSDRVHQRRHGKITEQNAQPSQFGEMFSRDIFDPFFDRHLDQEGSNYLFASKDLKAGSEVFDNYVTMVEEEDQWFPYVQYLKQICSGDALGEIAKIESN